MKALANLPVFLRLKGRKAVLAGSGDPAAWKAELLFAAGADVLVLAPDPSPKLAGVVTGTGIALERRRWRESDFTGALAAIAEAQDEAEAAEFRRAAHAAGALVNVIDRPKFCDFSFGSIVERSPLVIGISTDGAAPVFAQGVRSRIEAMFPESLRDWAEAARAWRGRFAAFDLGRRRAIWADFAARALVAGHPPTEADYEALAKGERAGRLIVVGIGPGDLDLLTLKAVRALQAADAIVEDGVIDPEARGFGRREASLEICSDGADATIRARSLALVLEGKTVVALRPGHGASEAWRQAAEQAGVSFEFVPGLGAP